MATITAPPRRPLVQTRRGGKFRWTIHTHPNHAFTVKMNEDAPTAIVGFKNVEHALVVGKMIEMHYVKQKEWPDTTGQLLLPAPHEGDLDFLFLRKWDLADLQVACTKNFLCMVSVEDLEPTKTGFNFDGKLLSFQAPLEFHIESLKEMYERPGPNPDL
jgi:hypothetical protein